MGAKKSKKHRKHGRNKRGGQDALQRRRTERNKVKRLNYERLKAGLPPVDEYTARDLMDSSRISR
jgi:hypothetical protein